ncbi:MAG: hypothetical protein WCC94_08795 [Candidatus Bathyarchaeia archaeon]
MSQIARYSHALTFGLLGATSILVPYVLHGSAGQYLRELGVGFGYVWTVRESVVGSLGAHTHFQTTKAVD